MKDQIWRDLKIGKMYRAPRNWLVTYISDEGNIDLGRVIASRIIDGRIGEAQAQMLSDIQHICYRADSITLN